MSKLLDYLLYALWGYNVTLVDRCSCGMGRMSWTFVIEGQVFIVLDDRDLKVIRRLYNERKSNLTDEERSRYEKIINACV